MAKVWFAWVDYLYTEFVPAVHARLDEEELQSVVVVHNEGEAAVANLTFKNPGIGLLSPSRSRYLLISESEDDVPENAVPTFRGRITGIPTDLGIPFVTVEAIAAPADLQNRLKAFAATIRTLPYDDPLADNNSGDPSEALAARSMHYYVDPVTHAILLSDIIEGETMHAVLENHAFSKFKWQFVQPPVRSVKLRAVIEYTQSASGAIDIAPIVGSVESFSVADQQPFEIVGLDPGGLWGRTASRGRT